ncbi:hypothetical protein OAG1_28480 [Agarivorans sp. OAG1]|uniref:hypothetical protein n=1 Tax=Agarivorans sp. OAG1 TaxID=3082387 RepID=UPI002B2DC816|nr:hypothetical protein OAG1_28480 [Agarivorans sp. OAG1]
MTITVSPTPKSGWQRKLTKLRKNPKLFIIDSKAAKTANLAVAETRYRWQQMGGFSFVILAFFSAVVYFTMIASVRYETESRVQVRDADKPATPNDFIPVLSGSNSLGKADALLIRDYLYSNGLIVELDELLDLRGHYQANDWDLISRLSSSASQEEFFDFYREHIDVQFDDMAAVLSIKAQGFTPEFSMALVLAMQAASEEFINRIGHAMAQEQIAFVEQELDKSKQTMKQAELALLAFQNQHQLLDPEAQGAALQALINQLEMDIVKVKTDLAVKHSYLKPYSVEITQLDNQLRALTSQLQEQKEKLVSDDPKAINETSIAFRQVELDVQFALDAYQAGLIGLEQVRTEAYRKLKHIVVIQPPMLAEDPTYPLKIRNLITIFIVLSMLYGVFSMVIKTIKENY